MKIGEHIFENGTFVMAILNLTPDSFYPPSRATRDDILFRAEKAVKEGAAVIDIGAQSTRPRYAEVSADVEISRLDGCIYDIKRNFDIPVSVDTYFQKTAQAALEMGADMINDVTGLTRCADMADTIAKYRASVCIMHGGAQPPADDIWQTVLPFLKKQTEFALSRGIERDRIVLDGGIGFAKNKGQNFELLESYEKISSFGYPSLLGVSRKSMFGGRYEDRLPQTIAATRLAVRKGVLFVRVHDVAENVQAIREENS